MVIIIIFPIDRILKKREINLPKEMDKRDEVDKDFYFYGSVFY